MRHRGLVIVDTHPVQYRAPLYRVLKREFQVPLTVIYGSNFSMRNGYDPEFKAAFSWDVDLLSGYESVFLPDSERNVDSISKISTKGLSAVLKKINPRAVLLIGYSPHFHLAAFWSSIRMGAPVLFRGEATDHAVRRNPAKALFRDLFLTAFYARCFRVLYAGRRYYEHFKRFRIPERKLIFSPYCVDTSFFHLDSVERKKSRGQIRAEHHINDKETVILFSGKLSHRKSPDLLVEAVRRMPDSLRNRMRILFMGEGELRDELQKLAGTLPKVQAEFVGFKNQTQISDYYCAADMLVLPSCYGETWGLVVNEALHHGIPAVVSDAVGCAPDLIENGKTGERFETGSATDLAQAIIRAMELIQNPETAERCRAQVNRYSVYRAAEGIARAYQQAIAMQ